MTKINYYVVFIIIFTCFVAACQKKDNSGNIQKNASELVDIWVEDSLNNQVDKLLLSDVAKDIEIIPLEFNKNHTFKFTDNIVIGDNNLFINTRSSVLHYDKKGKFINSIGNQGEGPSEFITCDGIGTDDKDQLVYVANGLGYYNEIKTYSYQGGFIKSISIAPKGKHMDGTLHREARDYNFFNNKHIFRRMLPVYDNSKDIWQIQIQDTSGQVIATFYDPTNIKYIQEFYDNRADGEKNLMPNYWNSDSPVQNRYTDKINFMFDSNDTIYQYIETKNSLKPRYILHCGKRPSFAAIRKLNKEQEFFKYIFVTDIYETKDYLYLVAEKDRFAYLLRVDKETGAIQSIKQEGKIIESSIMQIRYRKAPAPGFNNDLCGGLPFSVKSQNNKQWIAEFDAPDLLEKIDIEELKKSDVLLPEKRDQLVRILENLKEDDNPVIMVVTLK